MKYLILLMFLFWIPNVTPEAIKLPYTIFPEVSKAEIQVNDTLLVIRTNLSHNSNSWVVIHQEVIKEGETNLNVLLNDHQRANVTITTSK